MKGIKSDIAFIKPHILCILIAFIVAVKSIPIYIKIDIYEFEYTDTFQTELFLNFIFCVVFFCNRVCGSLIILYI